MEVDKNTTKRRFTTIAPLYSEAYLSSTIIQPKTTCIVQSHQYKTADDTQEMTTSSLEIPDKLTVLRPVAKHTSPIGTMLRLMLQQQGNFQSIAVDTQNTFTTTGNVFRKVIY